MNEIDEKATEIVGKIIGFLLIGFTIFCIWYSAYTLSKMEKSIHNIEISIKK